MQKKLFLLSWICTALLIIFLFTPVSLNGFTTDLYFFLLVLLLHGFCFYRSRKTDASKRYSLFHLWIAMVMTAGLSWFLLTGRQQVYKVYKPMHNKENLYASLSGWYKRDYFRYRKNPSCDGVLWSTKVPYYFPLIEIETSRIPCYLLNPLDRQER